MIKDIRNCGDEKQAETKFDKPFVIFGKFI